MYDFNSSTLFPADFFQQAEFLYELQSLEQLQSEGLPLHHTADVGQSEGAMSDSTPTSSDTSSDSIIEVVQRPQARKRQLQTSERCDSDALIRMRKTRKLRDRQGTAKVRAKGACYECQLKKKGCQDGDDPESSCKPCLEIAKNIILAPRLRPICWRPNIGFVELFRRGPTIDFAASLRGNRKDAAPGKQALWKHFETKPSGNGQSKVVQLSQGRTSSMLNIRLDRYQPIKTDKQYYPWFEDGVEQRYHTPAYGIANLPAARSAIDRFLEENFAGYIEGHMRFATEITRTTFQTAQEHKHLPLVERALKLWVCCRFIEDPWSIVGSETLGMSRDANPNCPYYDRIPVPPIVDLQIDLVVINEILKPELQSIVKILQKMLAESHPWTDWFEIYLAYFILLHNVELTMAHDLWFVKRHNLKKRYSNKALVDTITHGANTLLTCFHYAHKGYAPFSTTDFEHLRGWTEAEKAYLQTARPLIQHLRGDHVNDPAKELFWTSQLHRPDWQIVNL